MQSSFRWGQGNKAPNQRRPGNGAEVESMRPLKVMRNDPRSLPLIVDPQTGGLAQLTPKDTAQQQTRFRQAPQMAMASIAYLL